MKKIPEIDNGPKTCSVCFEDFGKYRRAVQCPGCPAEKPSSVCKECTKEYLLETPQDAHCMGCKHSWGYKFMHDTFDQTFLLKTYRKNRQEKALEREKGLLPQSLPLVEEKKRRDKIKKNRVKLREKEKALKEEYSKKLTALRKKYLGEDEEEEKKPKGTQYLFPCPVMEDDEKQCRGFIEKESWCCGLCEAEVCKKCHCQKDEKHKCKKENVETAKMVMEDTKPCPNCKARIFKIHGCDQMYCTQCNTPFSWNTGEIVKGVIHNPHYYEMLKKTGIAAPRRNAGDVPCGGIQGMETYIPHIRDCTDKVREQFNNIHRRSAEIEHHITIERRKQEGIRECEDIRVKWLTGEFKDEKAWQKSIFIRERSINKKKEELAILDTFVTAAAERFRDFLEVCEEIDRKNTKQGDRKVKAVAKFVKEMEKIRVFCNEAFETNYKAMNYKKWPCINFERYFNTTGYYGPAQHQMANQDYVNNVLEHQRARLRRRTE